METKRIKNTKKIKKIIWECLQRDLKSKYNWLKSKENKRLNFTNKELMYIKTRLKNYMSCNMIKVLYNKLY